MVGSRESSRTTSEPPSSYELSWLFPLKQGREAESSYEPGVQMWFANFRVNQPCFRSDCRERYWKKNKHCLSLPDLSIEFPGREGKTKKSKEFLEKETSKEIETSLVAWFARVDSHDSREYPIRANRKFEWLGRIGLTHCKNRRFNCKWFAQIARATKERSKEKKIRVMRRFPTFMRVCLGVPKFALVRGLAKGSAERGFRDLFWKQIGENRSKLEQIRVTPSKRGLRLVGRFPSQTPLANSPLWKGPVASSWATLQPENVTYINFCFWK